MMPSDVHAQDGISAAPKTGNLITKGFPNATKVGNTVVCHVRTTEATIGDIALSDDGSNTYTLRVDEIAGSRTNAVFTAPVTTTSKLFTVTYNDAAGDQNDNLVDCYEYENVVTSGSPLDVTCTGTSTSGTAPVCGTSMTPTVANDLIMTFVDVVTFSAVPTGSMLWTAQTGSPTYTKLDSDGTSWSASQWAVDAATAAITPSMTVSQAVTRANVVGIALKSASSGSGFTGIHVNSVKMYAPEYANSTATSTASQVIEFPCTGNSEWLFVGQGASSATSNLTGVTDSNSNTWTLLTNLYSASDGFAVQAAHVDGATCNGTEKITLAFTSTPTFLGINAIDVANATGYDSAATCTGGPGTCLINNANSTATTTFAAAAITPSTATGVLLSYQNEDFQSMVGGSPGNTVNAIESCPNQTGGCSGNGIGTYAAYAYAGSGLEQDSGAVVDYYSSSSAITITYTIAQTQGSSNSGELGPAFNYTVAVKQ
jgi:hypothetical protein